MRSAAGGLLLSLLIGGCSDATGPPTDPGALAAPRVYATLGFGDAPVTGEVILDPLPPSSSVGAQAPWQYEVDLDGDGDPDASGDVSERVAVPYRFEDIGPHRIEILLERGQERESREEFVVVNDPAVIEVLGSAELPSQSTDAFFVGIAIDRKGEQLFVGVQRPSDPPVYALDAASLAVTDSLNLEDFGPTAAWGLSAAPDEDLLYVADRGFDLAVLSTVGGLELLRRFGTTIGSFGVEAFPGRRALVGGRGSGLALIDTETGAVLREFRIPLDAGIRNFAVSPDRSRIALPLLRTEGPSDLLLLDAQNLVPIWSTDLALSDPPEPLPPEAFTVNDAVSFSADGERIYVIRLTLGVQHEGRRHFLVLNAADGRLVRRMIIDRDSGARTCAAPLLCNSGPNAAAISADGRFVAFSGVSIKGLFVDRGLDLPLYRTPLLSNIHCCGVAASPIADEFFFVSELDARVTKVRLRR
ncbi:MAG: YncE family protein [Gemmatimonadota bacterium]